MVSLQRRFAGRGSETLSAIDILKSDAQPTRRRTRGDPYASGMARVNAVPDRVLAFLGAGLCFAILGAGVASYHAAHPAPVLRVTPDALLHPGTTDRSVTQDNAPFTVCSPTWVANHGPRPALLENLKVRQMKAEHLRGRPQDYAEALVIPVELGGKSEDPRNLWPQPWERRGARLAHPGTGAEARTDAFERLHAEVCSGRRPLADAQEVIARWRPFPLSATPK